MTSLTILDNLLVKSGFFIGGFEIKFYAICIMTAFIACGLVGIYLFKKRGYNTDLVLDCLIAIIPCAIIGARLWYVLLELDEFKTASGGFDFIGALKIWEGGLAIHGGVFASVIGLLIVSKVKKVSLGKLTDIGAALLPLGQAIGRWGNFFNQEVYGKPTSVTWFPYSVYIERTGQYHHALFFYEMVLNLILFAVLFYFITHYKGRRNLYSTSGYLIGYGVIRAVLEPLRVEEFQMGYWSIPTSVLTAIGMIVVGVGILAFVIYKDVKDKNYWWKDFFKKDNLADRKEEVSSKINENEGE